MAQLDINSCAQTLYALRILRSHGMDDAALQNYLSLGGYCQTDMPPVPGGGSLAPPTDIPTTKPPLPFHPAKPAVII